MLEESILDSVVLYKKEIEDNMNNHEDFTRKNILISIYYHLDNIQRLIEKK